MIVCARRVRGALTRLRAGLSRFGKRNEQRGLAEYAFPPCGTAHSA